MGACCSKGSVKVHGSEENEDGGSPPTTPFETTDQKPPADDGITGLQESEDVTQKQSTTTVPVNTRISESVEGMLTRTASVNSQIRSIIQEIIIPDATELIPEEENSEGYVQVSLASKKDSEENSEGYIEVNSGVTQEFEVFRVPAAGGSSSEPIKEFTIEEIQQAMGNSQELLGNGGFGKVYKGILCERLGEIQVAIKILNKRGYQNEAEWKAEIKCLGEYKHPNLVKLLGYCSYNYCLVYVFMELGSLDKLLFCDDNKLLWPTRLKIALDVATGIQFLHNARTPLVHRDIKCSNILLDRQYNAKLADFGLARYGPAVDTTHVSTRPCGTWGYMDPAYANTGHLTLKSDVYAFGVVLLELISGERVIDSRRPTQ